MLKPTPLQTVTLFAILSGSLATSLSAQGTAPAPGLEQILAYDSDITVHHNATMVVRETITVSARGAPIQEEIYRDLLTRYDDQIGNPYIIHFDVVSLERDGQPEDFHLRKLTDGLRIHMGKSGVPVPPGLHTYELTYDVDREIGFFPDHDELYWNIAGNGWILPIQEISATVHLPRGITREAILLDAYTGAAGAVGIDYTASVDRQSNAIVKTTRPLSPHEGLALVARWPKGFVRPPIEEEQHHYFLEDNQPRLIGLLGLLVVLLYYVIAWFLAGRDPDRGEVQPTSEPPRGFSPAALRYLWRGAFDQKTMVANLVDLAVKKRLAILEDLAGAYILGLLPPGPASSSTGQRSREGRPPKITSDQKLVLRRLFPGGDTIRLQPAHHPIVGGAVEALHQHLRSSMEKSFLLANSRYLIPGLLISLAVVARCGFSIQGGQGLLVLYLALGLLLWSPICLTLAVLAIAAWRNVLSDPHHAPTARKSAVLMSVISLPFLLGEAVGLVLMAWAASTELAVVFVLLVAINYLFHILLKGPKRSGRALLNQIEGFRMFLTTTEQDPHDAGAPLPTTPDLFERFLPYALAFNVEKVWGEKFVAAMAQAAPKGTLGYSPKWYSGPGWNPITASTFASSLGSSFSSALSSSMRTPGWKSGSARASRGGKRQGRSGGR